ncbi:MAG TPA: 3'(2'),5'-bisphosphate nucleotidase CysQ [Sphingomonadaceae bacterium]|nr:3'(2'),5'-bisphosphate nucleotidase CysQ [Sphingomonadaceae bacterium]
MSSLEEDTAFARHIAAVTGELLLTLRDSGLLEGKALGRAGDRVANAFLMEALTSRRPTDAVLCEEEKDDPARCAVSRVWIIDPLDGTREYGEGRTDWAVHVALAIDGQPSVGAVALPALGLTFSSANCPPPSPHDGAPRLLVSRSRPAAQALRLAERIGAETVPMGSAGAKAMAVVRGDADIYLHAGGQYEWDNCAPVAVALAAGLHASRLDGSPLTYNHVDPYLPDLLICRKEAAGGILALLRENTPA